MATTRDPLKEVQQRLELRSPRKRRFESSEASLIVLYDDPNGDRITGFELIMTDVPDSRGNGSDVFISSDDYYKKFVVCPAKRMTTGLVRGPSAGHMVLDIGKVIDRIRQCTTGLESNIIDFIISRTKKYLY
jgi:hypothetical protein